MSSPIQSFNIQTPTLTGPNPLKPRPASVETASDAPSDAVTLTGKPQVATPTRPAFSTPAQAVVPTSMPQVTTSTDAAGTTTVHFIYDNDKRDSLKNLTLIGSWDNTGHYSNDWDKSASSMKPIGDGKFEADVKLDGSQGQNYQWGVKADSPYGKQQWAMFGENPPSFQAKPGELTETYAPRTYANTGVTKDGDDAKVRFWSPAATGVSLAVYDKGMDQPPTLTPLSKDDQGFWNGLEKGQWNQLDGKSYGFSVSTPEGTTAIHTDPYARQLQGQARGVGDLFLDPNKGQEVNRFWKGTAPSAPGSPASTVSVLPEPFLRFSVQQQPDADQVKMRLYDADGNPMSKADIEKRVGTSGGENVHTFEGGTGAYWHDKVADDGAISLQKAGTDAWQTVVDDTPGLQGLKYRFEVYKKDAAGNSTLVGDANHDGKLSAAEAAQTAFNDPYDATIKDIDSQRLGVIKSGDFDWKNPDPGLDKNKAVIYQAHVGSFMGDAKNARKSTFKDMIDNLDYFKDLGATTIELLPTNPFEGADDWGYLGTSNLSAAEQYGFTDKTGKWVSGPDAMKMFVDAAHGKGLSVVDDVVYNHFGGEYNTQYQIDGKANSSFDWGNGQQKNTDWGLMPAYNQPAINSLIQDSANSRLDDFHADGLRLDFTNPIHSDNAGGLAGWNTLRSLNRQVHFMHPDAIVQAEEFPPTPVITQAAGANETGGAGFDTTWNTEFQHRSVHDNSNPSVLQQAVTGQQTNMDALMNQIVNHPGYGNPQNATTIISDHDEVGNADRTINVARNYQDETPPDAFQRGSVRSTFGIGMLSPGVPMFFQGEESMADNTFKWGIPSTWDLGWDWKDKPFDTAGAAAAVSSGKEAQFVATQASAPTVEDVYRRLHFDFCKDAIALRKSSDAFDANTPAERVYTHNQNSVMAFSRQSGNDQFLVVSSLNKDAQTNYNIPIADGKWQLVLDSDSKDYGGSGMGDATVTGGQQAQFDLPAGAMLVYKKVG